MKKTIILIISVVVIIACMSLPVAASGINVTSRTIHTQYNGGSLCDKGTVKCVTSGYVKFKVSLTHNNGTRRGTTTHLYTHTEPKNHTVSSGWVDHSYNSNYVAVDVITIL
jgi:uncharacterized protein YxeA